MFSIVAPLPGFDEPTVKELRKWLSSFEQAANGGPVRGGVVSEGDAAAYALVWEWGNVRQAKQGPKTVKGINPDGEEVWLSVQAPFGYIRIHEPEFTRIIEEKLDRIDFSEIKSGQDIRNQMEKASMEAASQIAELIREFVPVDSGNLQESIGPVDSHDADLVVTDEEIELGDVFSRTVKKLKG